MHLSKLAKSNELPQAAVPSSAMIRSRPSLIVHAAFQRRLMLKVLSEGFRL